jgi:hypothetical protein
MKTVKELARIAYPGYRGRKFKERTSSSYTMQDYWDGGSRCYAVAVELATGRIVRHEDLNPMTDRRAGATLNIPQGFGILEHSIFCGKDTGITLVTPPLTAIAGKE